MKVPGEPVKDMALQWSVLPWYRQCALCSWLWLLTDSVPMEVSFTAARTTCNLRAAPKQTWESWNCLKASLFPALQETSKSLEEQEKKNQINIQSSMCEKLIP